MSDAPADPPPPSVLLLPALGQLPTAWQDVVTTAPTNWRVHAPWLPGLKPTDRQGFELDRAVGELVGFCEQRGIRRTHLVGVSLGAVVALRMAAHHPGLVDRLVLSGAQVAPPKLLMKAQLALLRRLPEARFTQEGLTKARAVAATEALAALDLRADLGRVQAPTLVLVGSADRAALPAAQVIGKGIRGARVQQLPGGAELNTASPGDFADAVFGFLREN